MAEPYVKKDPGDIIRAQDWNDMQSRARDAIEGHTHSGAGQGPLLTGAAIDPAAAIKVKSVAADTLSVAGADLTGRLQALLAQVNAALPLGGGTMTGALIAGGGVRLNNADIRFRVDENHGLGYYGSDKRFGGQVSDGPVLYGWAGGGLGSTNGGQRLALTWDAQQNVVVNKALTVADSITAAGSDIYFTRTDHKFSARGDAAGLAAIHNAVDYDSLMILGRAGTKLPNGENGRYVRLWDYLSVEGSMRVTSALSVEGSMRVPKGLSWGGSNAMLRDDQGGSLELGGNDGVAGSGTPYVDFHFKGKKEDYNVRLINDAEGQLSLKGSLKVEGGLTSRLARSFKSSSTKVDIDLSDKWTKLADMEMGFSSTGGPMLLLFKAGGVQAYSGTKRLYFRIVLDGSQQTLCAHEFHNSGWELRDVTLVHLATGVRSGNHNLWVEWRLDAGARAQCCLYQDNRVLMGIEL